MANLCLGVIPLKAMFGRSWLYIHIQSLAHIRQKIAANQLTAPLFDCARFTRHLESGFEQVLERYWAGLEPEHVVAQAIRQA